MLRLVEKQKESRKSAVRERVELYVSIHVAEEYASVHLDAAY